MKRTHLFSILPAIALFGLTLTACGNSVSASYEPSAAQEGKRREQKPISGQTAQNGRYAA